MNVDVIAYSDIFQLKKNPELAQDVNNILSSKGIIGVSGVPGFLDRSAAYLESARAFASLEESIKKRYLPNRDAGLTEGYELGAERFLNAKGEWQIDDKKSSYYAFVPDQERNKWPEEVDLRKDYLALGQLMLDTGRHFLSSLRITEELRIEAEQWRGYGRYLHYHKVGSETDRYNEWCGAHFDHCALTSLLPATYFRNGARIDEPDEAGLYVLPSGGSDFVKVKVPDTSVMLFQIGEFSQVASSDRIRATQHLVRKATGDIERFAFALFIEPPYEALVSSSSVLARDSRFQSRKAANGQVRYGDWCTATYEKFRVN